MERQTDGSGSYEGLIEQAERMGWLVDGLLYPRPTFDCPCLALMGALFQDGHSPTLAEFQPVLAARFTAGQPTIKEMVECARDFLEPRYIAGLPQEVLEKIVGEGPISPELLKMAIALQLLDEAWGEDIFDWYDVALS